MSYFAGLLLVGLILIKVVRTGCNRSVERSRFAESRSDEREQ